jgi:hypothetical protein
MLSRLRAVEFLRTNGLNGWNDLNVFFHFWQEGQ